MEEKEKDFQFFIQCLREAIKNVDAHYFQLPIAGDDPTYRERVYCYELYHQLRCILGSGFPYKLHGEVDKRGHPIIRNSKKPDFIIHKPGYMENLVVIEVKPVTVRKDPSRLKKDFRTLKWFLDKNNADYYRAIMLIYGSESGKLPNNIKEKIKDNIDKRILVFWHPKPNMEPKIFVNNG